MKKSFLTIIMLIFITAMICACSNNDPVIEKKPDGTWTVIENADPSDAYEELITGVYGSLKDISTEKVTNLNPIFSVDANMEIVLNERELILTFKMNYNIKNINDLKFAIEIIEKEDATVILGAYFKEGYLYIKIDDGDNGEMKIPLQNNVIGDIFPLEFNVDKTPNDIANYLSAIIDTKDNITGRTRMNGTLSEYEYSLEIDLPNTLQKIANFIEESGNSIDSIDVDTLSIIIQRIIGINFQDMLSANMPASSVTVDFSTSASKLSSFEINLHVDQDENTHNTLFGGDVIDLSLDLASLNIEKVYTSIPFFGDNEYSSYRNYLDNSFGTRINVKESGIEYVIKAEAKIDLETTGNNELMLEILGATNNKILGFYIKNNRMFIFKDNNGTYESVISFPIDFLDLIEQIKNGFNEIEETGNDESDEALEIVAYIVGAFRIQNEKLSFVADSQFYDIVLPNYSQIIPYLDTLLTEIDLQTELNNNGLQIFDYLTSHTFELYIETEIGSEPFVYILEEGIVFPEYVENYTER